MASEIKVPRLGWNMEQGTFLGWLKPEGATVQVGEPLFTLEGDKAIQEIEATDSGILRCLPNGPQQGETVLVGTVLGYLAKVGEEILSGVASSPVVAQLASPSTPEQPSRRRTITPRARNTATRLGVDWGQVAGTGRQGRIRERDIVAHAAQPTHVQREVMREPSPVRRVIAERVLHSTQTTAPVTLTTTVDATNLVNLRTQFRAAVGAPDPVVPSVTDFFVKLTARALQAHPYLNGRWQGDQFATSAAIHLGIAVDTEVGLLVPVIRDVSRLSLRQVARRSRELIDQARARSLPAEDLQGGTFTITNLGSFGIDAFTPIINWPEGAILGVGRIHLQPALVDNQIVPRELVTLSLTFDHRLVDGVPAARFLQAVCQGVKNPAPWLLD